jgi:predicted nucleic-acid-binding protein
MRAVDTNVLVRLVTRDDAAQVAAAEAFVASGAWVSLIVLAECIWVLGSVYDLDAPRLAQVVEMLLDHEKLALESPDVVRAALASFRRGAAKAQLTDCLLVEVARKAGHVPLGTFDRDLAKVDGAERISARRR